MTSEAHMEFCLMVREVARKRKRSLNRLFDEINESEDGVGKHWLRDRYYGKTKIAHGDLDRVKILLMQLDEGLAERLNAANGIQEAVNAFCQACVGEDIACRTRTCELRAYSPYPFVKFTHSRFTEFDPDKLGRD